MSLKHKDLEHCVFPEISVDEYEPKTGENEEVIVIALYVTEEDAAIDIDCFLERSSIDILDADVSPNPNPEGKYMVFIEMKRAPDFFEKFYGMLDEIENLSGKLDWKATTRTLDNEVDAKGEELRAAVDTEDKTGTMTADSDVTVDIKPAKDAPEEPEDSDEVDEDIEEIDEAIYELSKCGIQAEKIDEKVKISDVYLGIVDFGSEEYICDRYSSIPLIFKESYESNVIRRTLGDDWTVISLKEHITIKNVYSDNVILARI
jgi:hypothetical protein